MMTNMPWHQLLVVAFILTPATSSIGETPVEKYLKVRDRYIQELASSKSRDSQKDQKGLLELEVLLRTIIGPLKGTGFDGDGTINLETLHDDGGFGQVDGLNFYSASDRLFVTNERLLASYVANDKELPKDLPGLARNDGFYRRVFSWNAAYAISGNIAIGNVHGMRMATAFLASVAQDIGPLVPANLLVFAVKGDKIFVVQTESRAEQIQVCEEEWNRAEKKSQEAMVRYRASGLRDKKVSEDARRYENGGFASYRKCYGKNVNRQKFFSKIVAGAQEIVDRLAKAN